jgi:hypothetical protein
MARTLMGPVTVELCRMSRSHGEFAAFDNTTMNLGQISRAAENLALGVGYSRNATTRMACLKMKPIRGI